MGNELKRKYGLFTAICMVVGIVIGSGVFFKAGKVLTNNNGSMLKSLLTVALVGAVMTVCTYVFSLLAQRHERVNGVIDYAEVSCGPMYAYGLGWFLSTIYYPSLTSCLAWISAQYTCELFSWDVTSDIHVAIGAFYLVAGYALNALSPKIAGKFQVSTTVIKLVPLGIMAVVGTVAGLINGKTVASLGESATAVGGTAGGGILAAAVAFAFAYEGWIIATSINAELKNAKRNLPIALVAGSLIVVAVYLFYFLGLTGALTTEEMMASSNIPKEAFSKLFGSPVFGTIVYVFIVISCLGTMNGLMLGCCRGMYSVAVRGQGPAPSIFAEVDKETNMPTNSAIVGLLFCGFWFMQWELGLIRGVLPDIIAWENDELPIITLYASYIPIFIVLMIRGKEMHPVKRFVMPALAIVCCIFMVYAAFATYKIQAVYYLIVSTVVLLIGLLFYRGKDGKTLPERLFRKKKQEEEPVNE